MKKFHITSLLRPRGHYKSIEDQTRVESVALATTSAQALEPHNEPTETAVNSVDLIPTLNFVSLQPTPFETENVATTSASDTNANIEEDYNDDTASHNTYVIETTETTESTTTTTLDTEALLQEDINVSLSEVTTTSYFDEPTSSISIIMENNNNTATTTTPTTPATGTSSTVPTTTTTTPSTTDVLPATTPTSARDSSALLSSDQSIEEEIEEAIEISEEAPDIELSAANSTELSEAAGGSGKPLANLNKKPLELFGIDSEESEKLSSKKSSARKSSDDDEPFKIDDDQLSGGKLAQHFVLDDDDEENGDDFDVSLPLEKRLVHSTHQSSADVEEPEQQKESLSNQSTADDISDLVEEPRQGDGEDSLSVDLSLPLPEETQKSDDVELTQPHETDNSINKSALSVAHALLKHADTTAETLKQPEKTVKLSQFDLDDDDSPLHSEKDNSIGEIVEQQSINMSFEDKDVSSLNHSFLSNNQSLVNRLLADTIEEAVTKAQQIEASPKVPDGNENANKVERIVTDLDDNNAVVHIEPVETCVESLNVPSEEAKMLESTNMQALETLKKPTKPSTDAAPESRQEVESKEQKIILGPLKLAAPRELGGLQSEKSQKPTLQPLTSSISQFKTVDSTITPSMNSSKALELTTPTTMPMEPTFSLSQPVESSTTSLLNASSLPLLALKEEQRPRLTSTPEPRHFETELEDDEDESSSMELMKLNVLAMKYKAKEQSLAANEILLPNSNETQVIKPMERVPLTEFTKDVLEDITEESERNSLSTAEEQQSLSMEKSVSTAKSDSKTLLGTSGAHVEEQSSSVVSLNMLQAMEHKMQELQNMLASKDACLASLNLQLEASQRRESSGANSGEQLGSARDTSSLVTNSTEYRTFPDEFGAPTMDLYVELTKRDELIAKLTDSLQQSMTVRENLQAESDKLTTEVQLLRKQLTEAMDSLRRPYWPRGDQESYGQRISEISMDLISESDDDLERHFLTDNEDKYSRNSRERQLSVPRQLESSAEPDATEWSQQTPFSKQIEQFQKYLTPAEVRLFFMVQKKFDDFLSQELEKCKMKYEQELKLALDQFENEKQEKDNEIEKLLSSRREKDNLHSKEMEDLRKYFETKCADLEKQFSDDVFSQKSQRHAGDSSTDASDQEQMPEEFIIPHHVRSKEASPRKRSRAELLLSPSHRQLTPSSDAFAVAGGKDGNDNISLEIADMKSFYQNKIHDIQRVHEELVRKLGEKVKYYETRYPDDDFMSTSKNLNITNTTDATTNTDNTNETFNTTTSSVTQHVRDANTSLIIIDQDELNMNNESQVIQKIIEEYERRLQEQLTLAREDIVNELQQQIQTLLAETTTDDQHWPPELILLREKFTAKSQLQIAQLQIKHEEEMSRLKLEHEKQLNRKNKRHSTFDSARNLEQIISERDSLRELSKTFRYVLAELARCVVNCEDELNATVLDEVQRLLASSTTVEEQQQLQDTELTLNLTSSLLNTSLNASKQTRLVPDVHSLLEVIEDPSLLHYMSSKGDDLDDEFDLKDCMERLRGEANYLLALSENMCKRQRRHMSVSSGAEKNDSCCEGAEQEATRLQSHFEAKQHQFRRTYSLNEQNLSTYEQGPKAAQLLSSLPPDLNDIRSDYVDEFSTPGGNASELNFQVHELKNRLVKSETDRVKLQQELEHTIVRNAELGQELQGLRDQLSQLNSLNNTDYAEGYGNNSLKSPQRLSVSDKSSSSFAQLQEKARNILSSPTQQRNQDATVTLLQMIEDFCREGDKVVEFNKKDREDLQSQIDTADKQLKATRHFLEEQAVEREQERDEFLREIERLKVQLRDREKERNTYENASKELESLESQIRELTQKLNDSNAKCNKFEGELKAHIDKVFVLREIITELETRVETKALNEHVLGEKVKQLEEFVKTQNHSNESLQNEVQSLKLDISEVYKERIRFLEEKLQNIRPSAEQGMVLDQVVEQLRDIESTLDQKTKILESLHQALSSNSCSNSVTEDVSVHGLPQVTSLKQTIVTPPQGSPVHPSPRQHSLTMEGVQRIVDKLSKHSRVEEAAIKRIRDLEMFVTQMREACVELQAERDALQERMTEQNQRISTLQSRLDEQRKRAEELQRAGSFDCNVRIHDLQSELQNLGETLGNREKQIATLKLQLDKSKTVIDRLEAELAVEHQPDRSVVERLETELKQKSTELQKLKEKIQTEMINKLALPDLMETMMIDKNEEIDYLKDKLASKEKELQTALELNSSQASSAGNVSGAGAVGGKKEDANNKLSARTLSDIVSITEFDEPDVVRRAALQNNETPLLVPEGSGGYLQQTMETSKDAVANLTYKRTDDLSGMAPLQQVNTFENLHYFQGSNALLGSAQSGSLVTAVLVPRHINFSEVTDDSKVKTPNPFETPENKLRDSNAEQTIQKLKQEIAQLKRQLEALRAEKERENAEKEQEMHAMEEELVATQVRLGGLEHELEQRQNEQEDFKKLQSEMSAKSAEIEQLLKMQVKLTQESKEKAEQLSKSEKNLLNYQESEEKYLKRIADLEQSILKATEKEVGERESLRKELRALSLAHEGTLRDAETRKQEIEKLNQEIKARDERLRMLTSKLAVSEESVGQLQQQITALQQEIEKLRQQANSDNSSKQFSVDEIAQQLEKELNYSAQLDSNILKAIESEEENNLDLKHLDKESQAEIEPQGTDDENFTGERELLNQLEALKAQVAVERELNAEIRAELLSVKNHSQEMQEQDVMIIDAMRTRLETALEKEDDLHKQLDIERERCDRLQAQLTALQRAESRRNSLLKSPTESPRKSPRSFSDFESELAERLRGEIKLLTAQNERERERSADLQRNGERERQRYDNELQERVDYCEKLKKEMEKLARDKDSAEQECEHLQERLTLQTQEIESLESRLASLQEAETRRATRRDRQQKESAHLLSEVQEIKSKLLVQESEREELIRTITQLRFDVERSAQREAKLAEALGNANSKLANSCEDVVPQQFLQKMKEINALLAENTQENRQMADTVQFLVEERRQLQRKCDELEAQLGGAATVAEVEERCNQLLGRFLRSESHRKALIYQKRYLKLSLEREQNTLASIQCMNGGQGMPGLHAQPHKKKLFKTVALAIVAIQRMKYIARVWHSGKRIVSKSVFTITQKRRSQPPPNITVSSPTAPNSPLLPQQYHHNNNNNNNNNYAANKSKSPHRLSSAPTTPAAMLLHNDIASSVNVATTAPADSTTKFDWSRVNTLPL